MFYTAALFVSAGFALGGGISVVGIVGMTAMVISAVGLGVVLIPLL